VGQFEFIAPRSVFTDDDIVSEDDLRQPKKRKTYQWSQTGTVHDFPKKEVSQEVTNPSKLLPIRGAEGRN
jgi:hypothetical protein